MKTGVERLAQIAPHLTIARELERYGRPLPVMFLLKETRIPLDVIQKCVKKLEEEGVVNVRGDKVEIKVGRS